MEIGLIGLGKMGLNMALNLKDNEVKVSGFDISEDARKEAKDENIDVHSSLEELLDSFDKKRVLMLSLPAGDITNSTVKELCSKLSPGDIIIEAGNSNFHESVANYELTKEHGIGFLDCGTSGGMEGARYGACLMIGGEKEVFDQVEYLFEKLAIEKGYLYTGKPGSGHYLKMVHNGIEYGMMQAIGEGFDLLHASDYDFDLEQVASVFNHGSVIRSWLIELLQQSFQEDPKLTGIEGVANASGEGQWTVEEALRLSIPVPVIATSLFARNSSKIDDSFTMKTVATLRNQFGGHAIVKQED
ncbi:phosphogluconate dehydrogenase (NAD(+)-dependent, decarboxylating) [Alkalibacterium sp. MB6]|uniref:phosphogluconate dehydrogenase (NAD(+)-dependent, decarboxylating) n=1 Tax=Alkalibacterium sp. MB6 TaxID=2081965 RepID=UPI001379D394